MGIVHYSRSLDIFLFMPCINKLYLAALYYTFFFFFFFSSRRRHTRSVSAFLLNRSSDLAKDISNVVTDAASGVVDIFHGIDKAVADTWNNFWKDGKADGIGSNLSRK